MVLADRFVRDVEFESQGITLRGRFYGQDPGVATPGVVMSHGFSATIDGMIADRYAEVFQASGLNVLLYDHPYLGRSDGNPRQRLSVWRQARGIVDALAFLRTVPGVMPDRIALWGDSLSAGVAMTVAAAIPGVAALVLQVPSCGREFPPPAARGDEDETDRACVSAATDFLSSDLSLASFEEQPELPVVSPDQFNLPSWLTPLTAFRWFMEYGARFGTGWQNRATRAEPKSAPPYLPVRCAPALHMPVLFVIARGDEMPGSREDVARFAFERVPGTKELLEVEGGHFGLLYHPGAIFEQVSFAQATFLRVQLGITTSAMPPEKGAHRLP